MDGPGDQLLARTRFAVDQDSRIRGGDTADLVEHNDQRGTPTDDLLEVVDGLELLLEVEILFCQSGGSASASTRSVTSTQIECTA